MTGVTIGSTLRRPHVWLPGTGIPPLLLLHGTGGDEHDLVPLREHLAPGAPMLSPRGTVSENGMPRFFRRSGEGVFDEDDLRARVDELAEFLAAAEAAYGVAAGSWFAAGFSNGANIASALLFRRPEAPAGAVLMAGMVPFRDGPDPAADLTGKRVAVVNGRRRSGGIRWPAPSTPATAARAWRARRCRPRPTRLPRLRSAAVYDRVSTRSGTVHPAAVTDPARRVAGLRPVRRRPGRRRRRTGSGCGARPWSVHVRR